MDKKAEHNQIPRVTRDEVVKNLAEGMDKRISEQAREARKHSLGSKDAKPPFRSSEPVKVVPHLPTPIPKIPGEDPTGY